MNQRRRSGGKHVIIKYVNQANGPARRLERPLTLFGGLLGGPLESTCHGGQLDQSNGQGYMDTFRPFSMEQIRLHERLLLHTSKSGGQQAHRLPFLLGGPLTKEKLARSNARSRRKKRDIEIRVEDDGKKEDATLQTTFHPWSRSTSMYIFGRCTV